MRAAASLLVAVVLVAACGTPAPTASPSAAPASSLSPSPGATAPATAPPAASAAGSPRPPTAAPSPTPTPAPGTLLGDLPDSAGGVATTIRLVPIGDRQTPRVFLKVLARLESKPTDGSLALASTADVYVYALRVKDVKAADIMRAFISERIGAAGPSYAPAVDLGGKHATRVGISASRFAYVAGATFFYLECRNDQVAADVLSQLP